MKNSATNVTGFIIVMMLLGSAKVGAEQEPLYKVRPSRSLLALPPAVFTIAGHGSLRVLCRNIYPAIPK